MSRSSRPLMDIRGLYIISFAFLVTALMERERGENRSWTDGMNMFPSGPTGHNGAVWTLNSSGGAYRSSLSAFPNLSTLADSTTGLKHVNSTRHGSSSG